MIQKYGRQRPQPGQVPLIGHHQQSAGFAARHDPENISKLLDIAPAERSAEQKTTLAKYYRGIDPDMGRLRTLLQRLYRARQPARSRRARFGLGTHEQPGVFV